MHSGHGQLRGRRFEIPHLDLDEERLYARIPLGYLGRKPRGMLPYRGDFRLVRPIQFHLASVVPASYHRIVRRFHHLLHLFQRKPTDAPERAMGKLHGLCVHQRNGGNRLDGLGLLGGEMKEIFLNIIKHKL